MKTWSWLLLFWLYMVATNSQELDPELGIIHSASSPPTRPLQPPHKKSQDKTGLRTVTRSERLISYLPDTNRHSACLISCGYRVLLNNSRSAAERQFASDLEAFCRGSTRKNSLQMVTMAVILSCEPGMKGFFFGFIRPSVRLCSL